ncbi:hypothetical protein SAMN06265360_13011 [Haloechinothrix alba]|uniref:Uncharacterized protein n=1 Tax=Haloechinothrix alba TaxID=664784 RepID=A0A239A5E5_9PSEU|nr:hypothetical protein [Haloechinothrix alba]SNR90264.1 hypothetical protein SAMN06265360_13011 [Haloechinothrix alba]
MRIRTDDEVYRVDGVWLGPPRATFPWRVRYVAWGVGFAVFLLVLSVERQLGIGFGFFSTAWALVITVVVTKLITSKINHERPLGTVLSMWYRELTAPRERVVGDGGAVSASKVRVRAHRPRPSPARSRGPGRRSADSGGRQAAGLDGSRQPPADRTTPAPLHNSTRDKARR